MGRFVGSSHQYDEPTTIGLPPLTGDPISLAQEFNTRHARRDLRSGVGVVVGVLLGAAVLVLLAIAGYAVSRL